MKETELLLRRLASRAVSDDAGDELGFAIKEVIERKLEIIIGNALLTLARKPWIVPQLLRLTRDSRKAGRNLTLVVAATLERVQER